MQILRRAWSPIWAVAGVIAGIAGLMALEIIEEPDMRLGQILMELAEPVLIVLAVAGVVHLFRVTQHLPSARPQIHVRYVAVAVGW